MTYFPLGHGKDARGLAGTGCVTDYEELTLLWFTAVGK